MNIFFEIPISALKKLYLAPQPRGSPQTKTFTTPGLPKGPSFKPNHKPDFDFLKTDTYI